MTNEQETFAKAVTHCVVTFNKPKHKREYRDLSPRFWVALLDLEIACTNENWSELKASFAKCYRYLGAPGDFGYGTPCGDSLRAVYDTWNALCRVLEPEPTAA